MNNYWLNRRKKFEEIDEISCWKRLLTPLELSNLYHNAINQIRMEEDRKIIQDMDRFICHSNHTIEMRDED